MKKLLITVLALTLLACASAALAASVYRGQTSQHYPISLQAANGRVKFNLTYKLHCQHGSPTFSTATRPMNLRGQGFSYTFSEDMLTNSISGVFKNGAVSGTLNIHGSLTE
ncbi:MAG TPA: hypothetical protein VE197_07770, partial [Mycobacterium sp.]|nr:hypothetical protein [Mycobacterium sp.]